jgi:hypothetical protein
MSFIGHMLRLIAETNIQTTTLARQVGMLIVLPTETTPDVPRVLATVHSLALPFDTQARDH